MAHEGGERCRAWRLPPTTAAGTVNGMTLAAISWLLMGVILACAAVAVATDLESRIIPDRVALLVLCCGLGLQLLPGAGPLWASALSAFAVLCGLGLLAAFDQVGWGDVKLITALTFAVPPYRVLPLLLAITVTGALLGFFYLGARLVLRHAPPTLIPAGPDGDRKWSLRRLVRREGTRILANEPMPYAVAVLGGAVYVLAAT